MKKTDKEMVICVYDDNGPSINDKMLQIFEKYLKTNLLNTKDL